MYFFFETYYFAQISYPHRCNCMKFHIAISYLCAIFHCNSIPVCNSNEISHCHFVPVLQLHEISYCNSIPVCNSNEISHCNIHKKRNPHSIKVCTGSHFYHSFAKLQKRKIIYKLHSGPGAI